MNAALDFVAKTRIAATSTRIDAAEAPAAIWALMRYVVCCPTAHHAALLATLWHRARQRHHKHVRRRVPADNEGLREHWQRSREGLFAAAHHLPKARWNLSYVLQAVRRLRHGEERL